VHLARAGVRAQTCHRHRRATGDRAHPHPSGPSRSATAAGTGALASATAGGLTWTNAVSSNRSLPRAQAAVRAQDRPAQRPVLLGCPTTVPMGQCDRSTAIRLPSALYLVPTLATITGPPPLGAGKRAFDFPIPDASVVPVAVRDARGGAERSIRIELQGGHVPASCWLTMKTSTSHEFKVGDPVRWNFEA